ncbi:MAG: ABC transporter permease, partial [Pseudomonadota bacterium]
MQSLKSNALEPTSADLDGLPLGTRLLQWLPVYGLLILTIGLILLFSFLLPKTFPTLLN